MHTSPLHQELGEYRFCGRMKNALPVNLHVWGQQLWFVGWFFGRATGRSPLVIFWKVGEALGQAMLGLSPLQRRAVN